MNRVVGASAVDVSNDVANQGSTRRSHLVDGQLDGVAAPGKRSWGEFFQEKGRELSLKAALGVASVGFGGAVAEKQADAGIVLTAGHDPQARANGANYSVQNGGNVGYVNNGVGYASGVAWNQGGYGWALTAKHVDQGLPLSFGTGTNFNSNPGNVYNAAAVFTNPQYDVSLLKFNTEISGAGVLTFAITRPTNGQDVWLAGYGTAGTPSGYTTQDGFIRAGTSSLYYGSILDTSGFSSLSNGMASFRPFAGISTELRGTIGDSGGGVFTRNNEFLGVMVAASSSPSGLRTYFLDTTTTINPWVNSITAVPEPSSLVLLGSLAAGALAARSLAKRKKM